MRRERGKDDEFCLIHSKSICWCDMAVGGMSKLINSVVRD